MRYVLLIYEDEAASSSLAPVRRTFAAALATAGILRGQAALKRPDTATTLRRDSPLHDGPHAETGEPLAGLYLIEARDLDTALAWARRLPLGDGAVEVRPLAEAA
ncbi:hypothetical protein CFHF_03205 [Caulobacter flavus]|uniref:YCII-related domain-containing protein n=1 Tax=Caulobacter flavus TaxID=1679497 RepID=A0A2N5CYZ3_9CAUL|nr:YciI family protein [Caulobacter flavus]AYV45288.1 hypothetical protein C1707_02965 [Caulobacter flavus]PLR19031.1 hypothetical protein CFHF_03205 [Caulobacter flavus]